MWRSLRPIAGRFRCGASGLIGALLIGEKQDGGLYSQEEMETAQATGERIVHLLAGEQMMRRLMELQRKRTAEQRVMDLRTRRTLHDEILPALHLAVLQLSAADANSPPSKRRLTYTRRGAPADRRSAHRTRSQHPPAPLTLASWWPRCTAWSMRSLPTILRKFAGRVLSVGSERILMDESSARSSWVQHAR